MSENSFKSSDEKTVVPTSLPICSSGGVTLFLALDEKRSSTIGL